MTVEQVWERVEAGAAAALTGYVPASGGLESGEQRGERVYFVGEPEIREHQHYIGGDGSLLASFMVAASEPRGDNTTEAAKAVAGDLRRVRQAVEDAPGVDAVLAEGSTVRVELDEATVIGALRLAVDFEGQCEEPELTASFQDATGLFVPFGCAGSHHREPAGRIEKSGAQAPTAYRRDPVQWKSGRPARLIRRGLRRPSRRAPTAWAGADSTAAQAGDSTAAT